jgi:hypothetical protein
MADANSKYDPTWQDYKRHIKERLIRDTTSKKWNYPNYGNFDNKSGLTVEELQKIVNKYVKNDVMEKKAPVKKPIELLEESIQSGTGEYWAVLRRRMRRIVATSTHTQDIIRYIVVVQGRLSTIRDETKNPVWKKYGDQCFGFLRQALLMKALEYFPKARIFSSYETAEYWYCEIEIDRVIKPLRSEPPELKSPLNSL